LQFFNFIRQNTPPPPPNILMCPAPFLQANHTCI
jgi:hypothetical protein